MKILIATQPNNLLPLILDRRYRALYGQTCDVRICTSKMALSRAIKGGAADAYIVFEHLKASTFTADELIFLGDMAGTPFYPVLSLSHKGDEVMRSLYRNHIHQAVFETGDASAVAEQILPLFATPRRMSVARLCYGLEGGAS